MYRFVGLFLFSPFALMALDFEGYPCTQDCSGHQAGYDWAMEKGIDNPDNCGGNSNSFIEGCQAAAEDQQSAEQDDEESNQRGYDE